MAWVPRSHWGSTQHTRVPFICFQTKKYLPSLHRWISRMITFTWNQESEWCILPRCSAYSTFAARHQVGFKWILHIPVGQCPHAWSTRYVGSAVSRDTWLHIAAVMAAQHIRDVDHLTMRQMWEWQMFDQKIIELVIEQWRFPSLGIRLRTRRTLWTSAVAWTWLTDCLPLCCAL